MKKESQINSEKELKKKKIQLLTEEITLYFINAFVFLILVGGMWFINQYRFFNIKVSDSLFLGLAFCVWMLGIVYTVAYMDINKRLMEVKKNE